MKLLGNVLWLLFGGILIAFEYFVASILLIITGDFYKLIH